VGSESDAVLRSDARSLSDALSELMRVVQFRDRDRACCYDVSVSQCYALKAVADAGPLTVNDLAAHLYLDKSTASRIANGLEAKGYVTRQRAAEDRRVILLRATDRGEALCQAIEDDLVSEYLELLGTLSPEARKGITRLVELLAQSFAARVEASGGSCCVVS
jgi:MarR family 2-MHQ and catechol resistance regulon transcriptional repressor